MQAEESQVWYVICARNFKNNKLIASSQIEDSQAVAGAPEMIKSASIRSGRSLDLGQATAANSSNDLVSSPSVSSVLIDAS